MKNRREKILDKSECLEIVQKKLKRSNIEDYSLIGYEIIPIDGTTGFLGQYFTLKATVMSKESLDTRVINFFTKIPPPENSPMWKFNVEFGSFKKEIDLYTDVFPEVLKGLERFSIPECFFGLGGDVIVLEDMMLEGYTMPDKLVPFDFEHCQIVMKTLAKFHAKSITFEEIHKKNLLEEFPYCMHETLYSIGGLGSRGFRAAVNGIFTIIDLVEEIEEGQKAGLKDKIWEISRGHIERLGASKKFRNVICHGDLWANNVLFKYEDGRPEACCIVDFQLARYHTPAHDILSFLQFSTTRKLRDNHGAELFQVYYNTLSTCLIDAGFNADEIISLNSFLDSIEDLKIFSMLHGLLNIPIMLLDSQVVEKNFDQDIENLDSLLFEDRTPLISQQFREMENYRERMTDALVELHDQLLR